MTQTVETHRKTAIIVGFFFIIATAFLFIGEAFYRAIIDAPNFLETTFPNRETVIFGVLIEFICVLAIPLIAIFMFPVLMPHSLPLAIAYVVFRSLEAIILVSVAEVNKLSLIGISEAYLDAGGSGGVGALGYEAIGEAIRSANYWGDTSGLLYLGIFIVGALILYILLFRSKLLPPFLTIWGMVAAVLLLVATLLATLTEVSPEILVWLVVPIGVQEMVMALWLIFKGFNQNALK